MINVLCCIPVDFDQTSLYRGREPLTRLSKVYNNRIKCDYVLGNNYQNINWAFLSFYDVVFIQRPQDQETLMFIERFVIPSGKKLWIDYDDDMLNVPKTHIMHEFYSSESRIERIKKIISLADVVSVSCEYLKTILEPYSKKTVVIPNAFNDYLLDRYRVEQGKNEFVTWRGSATHENDVYTFRNPIITSARMNPDWTFNFFGDRFIFIYNEITNHNYIAPQDTLMYYKILHGMNSIIHIVPIHDDTFNRSKSNIAWIEGTFAGSICICPNFENWSDASIRYNSTLEFGSKLEYVISLSEEERKVIWENDWKTIRDKYLLSNVNELRFKLIEELCH